MSPTSIGRVAAILLGVASAMPWAASALAAQDDRPVLRGTVIDLETRAPVPNAMVAFAGSDRMSMSDSLGRFSVRVPPAWEYRVSVLVLGYQPTEFAIPEDDLARPLVIAIRPDPILLEGLQVLVDRFKSRRRSYIGSVQTLDQDGLSSSAGSTAMDVLRRRLGTLRPCPSEAWDLCVIRRGRREKATICIDEVPAYSPVADLELFYPEDLYLVEIYDRGLQVRIYTNWFVERAMKERRSLRPLVFGC